MQRLTRIDFAQPRIRVTRAACVLLLGVLAAGAWAAVDSVRVAALDEDVALLQQRADARQLMADKVRRAQRNDAPGQRQIDAAIGAQVAAKNKGAVPLLGKIGAAWTPRLALISVSVQRSGKEAKISGEAQDLGQVYAFVDRLRSGPGGLHAMLLRHGVSDGDPKHALLFDISVEQR
jgi:hypothetical protein